MSIREIHSQIDATWNRFWSDEISDPLGTKEPISHPLGSAFNHPEKAD